MTVQSSQLFFLPVDLLRYTFSLLGPLERGLFAETCRDAHQIISNLWNEASTLWAQRGYPEKEMKHCFLTPIVIQKKIPILFDKITSVLPYLLSSSGMTFRDLTGNLINAKCVYNLTTSALFFRICSMDKIQIEAIVPCIDSESDFEEVFNKPFSMNANSYAIRKTTLSFPHKRSLTSDIIINKEEEDYLISSSICHRIVNLVNSCKVELCQIELPPMDPTFISRIAKNSLVQKFNAENSIVLKCSQVSSHYHWEDFSIKSIFLRIASISSFCGR